MRQGLDICIQYIPQFFFSRFDMNWFLRRRAPFPCLRFWVFFWNTNFIELKRKNVISSGSSWVSFVTLKLTASYIILIWTDQPLKMPRSSCEKEQPFSSYKNGSFYISLSYYWVYWYTRSSNFPNDRCDLLPLLFS